MAIDLELEKQRKLSTQEMYEIIDFAVQAAEDNGFINSFIFHRALYLFAAIRLYEERRKELSSIVAANINDAWDTLLADGTLDDMTTNFEIDLTMLAEYGERWVKEYEEYAHSARGLLDTMKLFSGDIVNSAVTALKSAAMDSSLQEVLSIGEKWGLNNAINQENNESLFSLA